jgi:threonyl-tRNA synthetase
MSERKKILDHREIAKDLDLYFLDEKVGQGLPLLLPNYTTIYKQIKTFLQAKQKEFNFQEVMTPILGSEDLYRTSGHLTHYEEYMFPVISRNNENLRLRPMTCPHHCSIYQQKPRSYQELPLRLCENSLLFRYEASGGLKGLERLRGLELPDHHIFVSLEKLKEELKVNYLYISQILATFGLKIARLALSIHDLENWQKYHSDKNLWNQAEKILKEVLEELRLNYTLLPGEAAFYGPKLDIEVQAADGKIITLATMQIDFPTPEKFGLQYINEKQELKTPVIIHQTPIGSYQRFIALLIEQTEGKLPFWLSPCQVAILPLNEEKETKNYCEKLKENLAKKDLRVKIFTEKTLNYRIRQIYKKKIPYYLVVGKEEIEKKMLKLTYTYLPNEITELTEKELYNKLEERNSKNGS